MTTIARFLPDEPDPVPFERGLVYEQLTKEAREWGNVSWRKNAAFGRLKTVDGDTVEVQWPADSGRHDRPGFVPNPSVPQFRPDGGSEEDTEVKLLEAAAARLDPADDGLMEIFTELPPCDSCQQVLTQFHATFPNVQVRIHYRGTEVKAN